MGKTKNQIQQIAENITSEFEVEADTHQKKIEDIFDWKELMEVHGFSKDDLPMVQLKVAVIIEGMISDLEFSSEID